MVRVKGPNRTRLEKWWIVRGNRALSVRSRRSSADKRNFAISRGICPDDAGAGESRPYSRRSNWELASAPRDGKSDGVGMREWAAGSRTYRPRGGHRRGSAQDGADPARPRADNELYFEVRAGTGGDEARSSRATCTHVARYAETRGQRRGFAENARRARRLPRDHKPHRGATAHSRAVSSNRGVHRVQRVAGHRSPGTHHTSAVTCDPARARRSRGRRTSIPRSCASTTTARRSGAERTSKRTESAIRITHSHGTRGSECQDERSRTKTVSTGMALMKAQADWPPSRRRAKRHREEPQNLQVRHGDRSERIRTYNFPAGCGDRYPSTSPLTSSRIWTAHRRTAGRQHASRTRRMQIAKRNSGRCV